MQLKLYWAPWQLKCHSSFLPSRQTVSWGVQWHSEGGTYLSTAGRRNNEVGDNVVVPQILGTHVPVGWLHLVLIPQTVECCLCYVHPPGGNVCLSLMI